MGVPPKNPFIDGFSLIHRSIWDTSILGNLHMYINTVCAFTLHYIPDLNYVKNIMPVDGKWRYGYQPSTIFLYFQSKCILFCKKVHLLGWGSQLVSGLKSIPGDIPSIVSQIQFLVSSVQPSLTFLVRCNGVQSSWIMVVPNNYWMV